jgi:predicted Fe-Mo cluster-binding NifX family protein
MPTIITSTGKTTSAPFDRRFGRAAWFCLFDEKTGEIRFVANKNKQAINDAGTKSAEEMMALKAGKVISGEFGSKAMDLLQKANIQLVILPDSDFTIQDIISKLEKK